MIETGNFTSFDQTVLFFRAIEKEKQAPTVVLVHGFAEHSGRYTDMMYLLRENGFNVFAFDLRGHGHSHGKRGHIEKLQDYIEDLGAAVSYAMKKNSNQKVFIIGHSMGGLIAAEFARSHKDKLHGLVMSSPLFGFQVEIPAWKMKLASVMSSFWPSFSLPSNIDAKLLTHDVSKAEDYKSDPMIFNHVTARWFEEISKATKELSTLSSKLTIPILLQQSGDDRIVSKEKSCHFFDGALSKDKNFILYPGFFHEIYNEVERKKPLEDALSWILKRTHHVKK